MSQNTKLPEPPPRPDNPTNPSDLNFNLPGYARWHIDPTATTPMPVLQLTAPDGATASIYRHGAHLTDFQPADHAPVLWMSDQSIYDGQTALRGGVPICLPWFGPKDNQPDLPSHGFVRNRPWDVQRIEVNHDTQTTLATFTTEPSQAERAMCPYPFLATYTIKVCNQLTMTLELRNTGDSDMIFEAALHTYFAVGDVRHVSIRGLENTEYLSKVEGGAIQQQPDEPISFTQEIDRVYRNTEATCILEDPTLDRQIRVKKTGSPSTVIWNPWIDKAKRMADFDDDEWSGMCCIETAAIAPHAITLEPGQSHVISATLMVM